MTNVQESKVGMYNTSYNHLYENRSKLITKKAAEAAFDKYKQKLDRIGETIVDKARKLAGVALYKKMHRLDVKDTALAMAGNIVAYASSVKNFELKKAMKFNESELNRKADNEVGTIAKSILAEAMNHKGALVPDYFSDQELIEFEQMILEYNVSSTATRNATNSRKSLGITLVSLLADLDEFVKDELDNLMLSFKKTDPLFYLEYQNNRKGIDPKTSPTQFEGLIFDEVTNKPIKNALVMVVGTTYITNAKSDGSFKLRVPKTGECDLVVEVIGYEIATVKAAVLKLGKTTEVKVGLKAIK